MMDTSDVWHDHREALFAFIKRRVTNEFDAEDILQDVFRKIHSTVHTLSDDKKLRSWIYHIARNAITDYYRAAAKRKKAEIPLAADFDVPEQPAGSTNLNEAVSGWLKCFVLRLENKYKEALLLTEFEHLTQKELADRLGISVSGAKSRVQRGRAKVRELLLQCCHIERDRLGNVIDVESSSKDCSCTSCRTSFD
jgi:RNA polymerase sigma-70 factor (ECF subfamily)